MGHNAKVIEIQLSKRKQFLLLLCCIVFVILGIWISTFEPVNIKGIQGKIAEMIFQVTGLNYFVVLGSITILFFGGGGLFILKQLLNHSLALIITEEGIIDCLSLLVSKNCFVEWIDVVAIEEIKINKQKFISFIVKDQQKYLNQQKSFFKKMLTRINLKTFGSVISISSNLLKCSHEELSTILNERFDEFCKRQSGNKPIP